MSKFDAGASDSMEQSLSFNMVPMTSQAMSMFIQGKANFGHTYFDDFKLKMLT